MTGPLAGRAADRAVAVVTDSAASLPAGALARYGIEVVPMTLVVGSAELEDGDLAPADLVARLGTEPVSTSAPSPGAFLRAIERLGHRPVRVATVAARMSASHEAAQTDGGDARGPVAVLDTRTAAGGQGLVVLAAARAAAGGASLTDTVRAAERVAGRVQLVAALENLDQLARSGRVPGVAARASRSLHLRPLFEFTDGRAVARRPAHGRGAALERLAGACAATAPWTAAHRAGIDGGGRQPRLHGAVLHAEGAEDARELAGLVRAAAPVGELFVAPFSSVMGAHTGPGVVGLAWWWEHPRGAPPTGAEQWAGPHVPADVPGGAGSGEGAAEDDRVSGAGRTTPDRWVAR